MEDAVPNHCSNCWRITGPEEEVKKFTSEWERLLSFSSESNAFDAFLPMPQELKDISTGSTIINNKKYDRWTTAIGPSGERIKVPLSDEMLDEFQKKFGATDWYEWANLKWGTKWGAYSCLEPIYNIIGDGKITVDLYFESAWSPPTPALKELGIQNPNWIIEHAYAEQGSNFIGLSIVQGEEFSNESYNLNDYYTSSPDPETMSEDEIEQFWEDWSDTPLTEKYNGFAYDIFTKFPHLHEGG